jgi:5'(3')-deoxyribonucleotidase
MKILVDLDGVCYEWQRTARYILNAYRGTDLPPIDEWWDSWEAIKDKISRDDWKWLWSEGVANGLFRYGHMTTHTRVALQELLDDGHTIGIATSRPANAVNDTIDWCSLYFKDIPLTGIYIGPDKDQLAGDILVDDKIENCQNWLNHGMVYQATRRSLLYDRPWNRDLRGLNPYRDGGVVRAEGWQEVVRWIREMEEASKSRTVAVV